MKGYRTIIVNALIAAATGALQYGAGVNWIEAVGPTWSALIITGINVALRLITTTPVGKA